jgi:uncharacterized protein (TIGR02058 family)
MVNPPLNITPNNTMKHRIYEMIKRWINSSPACLTLNIIYYNIRWGNMESREARLIVEIGTGIDLLGGDVNLSVRRAINDIIHRVCIPFFTDAELDPHNVKIIVDVYTPYPEQVEDRTVVEALPVKPAELTVRKHRGGALVEGLGKTVVSIVAITIILPMSSG